MFSLCNVTVPFVVVSFMIIDCCDYKIFVGIVVLLLLIVGLIGICPPNSRLILEFRPPLHPTLFLLRNLLFSI